MKTVPHLFLVAAAVALTQSTAFAQTNATNTTNGTNATNATNAASQAANVVTNRPTIPAALSDLWNAIETSGLATATNYAVEPYLTYAPDAPNGNQVGGGMFLCYNVSSYIGTGLGFDYLGEFSLVSANLELKAPTHPFKNLTFFNGALTNVAVCPFVIGGLGKSLGGGGDGAIAATDAGAYVGFGHLWGGQFNAGFAYGRWDNAGNYSGERYHIFAGWSKGF